MAELKDRACSRRAALKTMSAKAQAGADEGTYPGMVLGAFAATIPAVAAGAIQGAVVVGADGARIGWHEGREGAGIAGAVADSAFQAVAGGVLGLVAGPFTVAEPTVDAIADAVVPAVEAVVETAGRGVGAGVGAVDAGIHCVREKLVGSPAAKPPRPTGP